MYLFEKKVAFATLTGKVIVKITRIEHDGNDALTILTQDGGEYLMTHQQDCCENVTLDDVAGDLEDLVGEPLLQAEESSNHNETPKHICASNKLDKWDDSWTWTFYRMATKKGQVVLRWLGKSNGYYSESVDLYKLK